MTANEELLSEAVRLGLSLDRLAQHSFDTVLERLVALRDELAVLVIRIDPTAVVRDSARRARLEALIERTDQAILNAYGDIQRQVDQDLDNVGTLTQDSLSALLALLLLIKGLSREMDRSARVDARKDTLIEGAAVADWWDRQAADMQFRVRRVLEDALRMTQIGKEPGTGDLVSAIRDTAPGSLFSAPPRHAEGLIVGAHHAVANRIRFEIIQRHPELFRAYMHVSVLDSRTCLVSGTMLRTPDGEKAIDQIKEGESVIGGSGQERKVLRTISKAVKKLIKVTMDDGTVIFCTPDHLFLSDGGSRSWKEAQDLCVGEEIATVLK